MNRATLVRRLKIAGLAVAALAVVAAAGVAWLTGTAGGFRYLAGLAGSVPGVAITAEGVTGTPATGFAVSHLTIDHERVLIEIRDLRARVNPVFLLGGTIDLAQLSAAAVHVYIKPRRHPPEHTTPAFLPAFLRLTASQATVQQLIVDDPSGELFRAQEISAGIAVSRSRIRIAHVGADAGNYAVHGEAELTAADPLGLAGTLDFLVPVRADRLVARALVMGNLDKLHIDLTTQRPAGARYIGDVDLTGTPRLQGLVTMAIDELAPLASGAPLGRLDGTLTLEGTLHRFTLRGPLRVQALQLGELQLALEAGYADDALDIAAVRLSGSGARAPLVEGHGRVRFKPATSVDVDVQWQRLRWPLSGTVIVESPRGSAHAAGYEPLAVTLSAELTGPQLPATTLAAEGAVQSDRVDIRKLSARLLEGEIAATGSVSWAGQRPWELQASARRVNPGPLRPALRGRIDATARASGRGYDPRGFWNLDLQSLSGQVRGRPVSGGGTASMRDGDLAIAQARLNIASLKATANGTIGRRSDLQAAAELGNLGDFLVDGGGSARLHGTYVAAHGEQQLKGTLEANHLRNGPTHLDLLTARADVDTASTDASEINIVARGLATGSVHIDTLNLAAAGVAAAHTLSVSAQSADRRATLTAHGMYSPNARREHLSLNALEFDAPRLAHYALAATSALDAGARRAALERTCVTNGDSTLCLQGEWLADGPWSAVADVMKLPLATLPLPLPDGAECLGAVSVHASAAGHSGAPPTGTASAQLDGVEFRYRAASGRHVGVKIGTGTIDARAEELAYVLQGEIRTTADSFLHVDAHAQRSAATALGDSPLDGQVRLRTRELDAIPILVRDIDRVSGLLESDVTLGGTIAAPSLDGKLTVSDGAADIYLSNLRLTQIAATIGLHGQGLDLDMRAHAGTGQLAASGALGWDQGKPTGTLKFSGENLLVANLPEARVVASPDVTLAINGQHIDVRGTITIPSATIAPKDLSTAVRVSSDQVIVGAHGEPASPQFTIDSQVKVVLGADVRVAAYGLKGLLAGSILIDAKSDELVTGTGELEVRDGRYLAYAREMDIERGRLLFRGGPVDNAGLDIRASRKLPGYTAGVNVRGTLQAPQLSFFSDPPLPQSQIASLLIVGATNDVGQGGSLLAAQGSALLVGDYTHLVGIDQMTVEADATNGTALVLGKFLSPRLYVSYGISLAQAINTLKLRYTIGDNWVINTESGLNHSADIQYSFQR